MCGVLCVYDSAKIGLESEDILDSELAQLESIEISREARD